MKAKLDDVTRDLHLRVTEVEELNIMQVSSPDLHQLLSIDETVTMVVHAYEILYILHMFPCIFFIRDLCTPS